MPPPGFVVWLTGLPASGKSTITSALHRQLCERGIASAVLESDAVRNVLTPSPSYSDFERDLVYAAIAWCAQKLAEQGIAVIVDATGHQRRYRDRARSMVLHFAEVYVDCPLATCVARDPKGIYSHAARLGTVPGLQVPYEPPFHPELVVHGDREDPAVAAGRVIDLLESKGFMRDNCRLSDQ